MPGKLKSIGEGIFNLFFPPICSICGAALSISDDTICGTCRNAIEPIGPLACPACARPAKEAGKPRCNACKQEVFHFQNAFAAFHYRGRLAEAIQKFKYEHRHELGLALARAMFMALHTSKISENEPDVLIAVPMHFLRRIHRGYNHSEILAEEYGKLAGIPATPELLVRIRRTPRQSLLPPERRARNVLGAFEAPDPSSLRGLAVGLVDDVLTSGHTVNECARMLIAAGAAKVQVIALARA